MSKSNAMCEKSWRHADNGERDREREREKSHEYYIRCSTFVFSSSVHFGSFLSQEPILPLSRTTCDCGKKLRVLNEGLLLQRRMRHMRQTTDATDDAQVGDFTARATSQLLKCLQPLSVLQCDARSWHALLRTCIIFCNGVFNSI